MKSKRFSPWKPYPPGVVINFLFAPVTLAFLVLGQIYGEFLLFFAAMCFGGVCILNTAEAAYHAGLRAQSHAQQLIAKEKYDEEIN